MSGTISNIRTAQIAAATAVVGYDLLTNVRDARANYSRVLDGLVLVGSAAAGDTEIELFIGGKSVGKYINTSTGVAYDRQKDLIPMDIFIPANSPMEARVTDAASTNAVVLQLEFHAAGKGYSGGRNFRRTYRSSSGRRQTTRSPRSGMY